MKKNLQIIYHIKLKINFKKVLTNTFSFVIIQIDKEREVQTNDKDGNDLGLLKATNLKLTQLLAETKRRYQEKQAQLEQLYKELNIKNKITYNDLTNSKNGRKPIHLNIKLQNECKPHLQNNNNNSCTINTISLTEDKQ